MTVNALLDTDQWILSIHHFTCIVGFLSIFFVISIGAIMKQEHTTPPGETPKNVPQSEMEKKKVHIIVEIIEYVPKSVVSKTIIKKTSGNISVSSFDTGEELAEKTAPFDTYIQIIDGSAEITINDKQYVLKLGEGIVIPAHASHSINANEQFKMVSTVIKSGVDD